MSEGQAIPASLSTLDWSALVRLDLNVTGLNNEQVEYSHLFLQHTQSLPNLCRVALPFTSQVDHNQVSQSISTNIHIKVTHYQGPASKLAFFPMLQVRCILDLFDNNALIAIQVAVIELFDDWDCDTLLSYVPTTLKHLKVTLHGHAQTLVVDILDKLFAYLWDLKHPAVLKSLWIDSDLLSWSLNKVRIVFLEIDINLLSVLYRTSISSTPRDWSTSSML